jgi:hypothetical protein
MRVSVGTAHTTNIAKSVKRALAERGFAMGLMRCRETVAKMFGYASSAEFVARFFAKVKDDVPFAAALAATKREFIRGEAGEQAKAPAAWAAFIYYGQ